MLFIGVKKDWGLHLLDAAEDCQASERDQRAQEPEHRTRGIDSRLYTVCPRSSDPFYIVRYYIQWVTTSWTYSNFLLQWIS